MNQRKLRKIIVLIVTIYLCGLGTSYAIFSETIKINGVARTIDNVTGDDLKVKIIKLDSINNRYSIDSYDTIVSNYKQEVVTDNTLDLYYNMVGTKIPINTITYTIQLINNTNYTFTNGSILVEIPEEAKKIITNVNGNIDKTILNPGETVNVDFTIESNTLVLDSPISTQATISYTMLGKTRYYYFNVIYK